MCDFIIWYVWVRRHRHDWSKTSNHIPAWRDIFERNLGKSYSTNSCGHREKSEYKNRKRLYIYFFFWHLKFIKSAIYSIAVDKYFVETKVDISSLSKIYLKNKKLEIWVNVFMTVSTWNMVVSLLVFSSRQFNGRFLFIFTYSVLKHF